MKAYKLEILIIDHDCMDVKEVVETIENANFPNDCINPQVMDYAEVDIGEWTDDHPLNSKKTCKQEYERLFLKG